MNSQELEPIRHSLAHLLAAAVMQLWPDTKRTIGPAIDNGFYFDFEFSKPISEADLEKIEKKMREILPTWSTFTRHELTSDEAKKEYPNNPYKHELIDEFTEQGKKKVGFYKSGDYWDLCKGNHVADMSQIDPASFKLDRLAGAYWRGDEKNKMLTRIYGLAFANKKELDDYLQLRIEAEKRDHKKLGRELDLWVFSDLVGGGLPLWTPRGVLVRDALESFVWELRSAAGYIRVDIPHIAKKELYETSGHWEKFENELFKITSREGHQFALKPMNCPHHTQIYARKQWSYRELPQRYANTTKVYRDEQSGELAGLARVRAITQDDAHVFCRFSQATDEAKRVWQIVKNFYGAFGMPIKYVRLSLHDAAHPENYLGSPEIWRQAENDLRELAKAEGATLVEAPGEAAFYGPKVDFMVSDSIGREWQVATIQLDMNLPNRFDLYCINEKGEKERIVMIHAAIMGSIERFLAPLIEHFAGALPLWLSPVQVAVLTVTDKQQAFAEQVAKELEAANIRVETKFDDNTLGKKIKEVKLFKTPYTIIIGDREASSQLLTVETRDGKKLENISVADFIKQLQAEIKEKK